MPAAPAQSPGLDPTFIAAAHTPSASDHASYAELKRMMRERGLMEKQPGYYTAQVIRNAVMLAAALAFLIAVDNYWLRLLDAVFLAFVFTQIGFMGHDLGHRQFLKTDWRRDILGLIAGNLIIGISRGWWEDKHNAHHSNPNQLDLDPDIDIPVLAFTEEQALEKRGLQRFIVKHQAAFFFPLCTLQGWGMHVDSLRFLFDKRPRQWKLEAVLVVLSLVWLMGLAFALMGFWGGLVWILVQQAVFGLYLASVFAPNHKGMPIIEKDDPIDFLHRQVVTARNVVSHPVIDFWYGGLNYQIEHHLFPTMPRNRLRESQVIVQAYCEKNGIPYYETGMLQSYREILGFFHEVSAPLRRPPAAAQSPAQ